MAKKIIGYSKFNSKKGTPMVSISCIDDYTQNEIDNNSAEGQKALTVIVCDGSANDINDKCIGRELIGFFGYNNGTCFGQSVSAK